MWGGRSIHELGTLGGKAGSGVAIAFADHSKTVELRGWSVPCVKLPSGEKVTLEEYQKTSNHLVYMESDSAGKKYNILLRLVSAPERLDSHGHAVAKHKEAALPQAVVEASQTTLPAGFTMDYSAKAGAAFYYTVFGTPTNTKCAALQVDAVGMLHSPPHHAQPGSPSKSPNLIGGKQRVPPTVAAKAAAPKAANGARGGSLRPIVKAYRGTTATAAAAAATVAAAAANTARLGLGLGSGLGLAQPHVAVAPPVDAVALAAVTPVQPAAADPVVATTVVAALAAPTTTTTVANVPMERVGTVGTPSPAKATARAATAAAEAAEGRPPPADAPTDAAQLGKDRDDQSLNQLRRPLGLPDACRWALAAATVTQPAAAVAVAAQPTSALAVGPLPPSPPSSPSPSTPPWRSPPPPSPSAPLSASATGRRQGNPLAVLAAAVSPMSLPNPSAMPLQWLPIFLQMAKTGIYFAYWSPRHGYAVFSNWQQCSKWATGPVASGAYLTRAVF